MFYRGVFTLLLILRVQTVLGANTTTENCSINATTLWRPEYHPNLTCTPNNLTCPQNIRDCSISVPYIDCPTPTYKNIYVYLYCTEEDYVPVNGNVTLSRRYVVVQCNETNGTWTYTGGNFSGVWKCKRSEDKKINSTTEDETPIKSHIIIIIVLAAIILITVPLIIKLVHEYKRRKQSQSQSNTTPVNNECQFNLTPVSNEYTERVDNVSSNRAGISSDGVYAEIQSRQLPEKPSRQSGGSAMYAEIKEAPVGNGRINGAFNEPHQDLYAEINKPKVRNSVVRTEENNIYEKAPDLVYEPAPEIKPYNPSS